MSEKNYLSELASLLGGLDRPNPSEQSNPFDWKQDPYAGLGLIGEISKQWDVFIKAAPIRGQPHTVRVDAKGYIIHWLQYGNRGSAYGWEMDHFPVPKSRGGSDDLRNLRPLNWLANARHGGLLGALGRR